MESRLLRSAKVGTGSPFPSPITLNWSTALGVSGWVFGMSSVATTWPLSARLATHLPTGTDTLSHYWKGWATLQAALSSPPSEPTFLWLRDDRLWTAQAEHGLGASVVRPGMVVGPQGRVFFPHLGYNFQDRTFVIIGGGRIDATPAAA